MVTLTEAEKKWIKRVQRALDACPSHTLGFYTIGDSSVIVYRKPEFGDLEDDNIRSKKDFCTLVGEADAHLGDLMFPSLVHSTAG